METPENKGEKPAHPAVRRRRRIGVAVLAGLFVGGGGGISVAALTDLPALAKLEDYRPPTATRILDRDGRLIDEIFIERRDAIPYEEIPETCRNALVATEDARFYKHHGIDFFGLVRAIAKGVLTSDRIKGTSTLTQQLAKNLFLTPERSLVRKLKEATLAFQIERKYTKEQILTLYYNQIYLGSGTFGIEAASKRYFGKKAKDMSLGECAVIAGLPKSPSGYDPFKYPDRAKLRRDVVLVRMRDAGYLTPADAEKWKNEPLGVLPAEKANANRGGKAPYFVAMLKPELEARFGEEALYEAGLQVWTSLDLDAQIAAEQALASGVAQVAARQADWARRTGKTAKLESPQGALIAIDPATGDVRALVGGTSWAKSQYNRAVQAKRQPGSAFKPIVYAAAIENGWTQSSQLWDAPISYTFAGKTWQPKNYYPGFMGKITMRTALEQSSNAASIYLLERIGVGAAVDEARRLGITSPLQPNLTLALGSSDMTLGEITRAYAAFANGGVRTDMRTVLKVLDANDRPLYSAPPSSGRAVMTPETAYVVSDLLHGVTTHGLSKKVGDTLPFWVGGKTGTTNNSTDALFVGYSSNLAAGVWVGLDSHAPMPWGESGGRAAQPIWLDFMQKAAPRLSPALTLTTPQGVTFAEIDPATGLLATEQCAERLAVAFVATTEPTRACDAEAAGTGAATVSNRFTFGLEGLTWD